MGVDAWVGDGVVSSPSLSWVTLSGNGGDECERGGGLLVTSTSPTTAAATTTTDDTTESARQEIAGEEVPHKVVGRAEGRHGQTAGAVLTLSGCVVRNNTALLGGGIAVSPEPPLSFSGPSPPATFPTGASSSETEPAEYSPNFFLRETTTTTPARHGGNDQRTTSTLDDDTITPITDVGVRRSGSASPAEAYRAQERLAALESSAGARNSGVAAELLGLVMDRGTIVEENRAAFGGGIWASGAAVTAMGGGGGLSIRGNIAEGLREGCVEEVTDFGVVDAFS